VEVFSNVLDEDNQAGWETLQQNSVGSQALLNNAERYALFVAMATNGSSNNISISRDNIGKKVMLTLLYSSTTGILKDICYLPYHSGMSSTSVPQ